MVGMLQHQSELKQLRKLHVWNLQPLRLTSMDCSPASNPKLQHISLHNSEAISAFIEVSKRILSTTNFYCVYNVLHSGSRSSFSRINLVHIQRSLFLVEVARSLLTLSVPQLMTEFFDLSDELWNWKLSRGAAYTVACHYVVLEEKFKTWPQNNEERALHKVLIN